MSNRRHPNLNNASATLCRSSDDDLVLDRVEHILGSGTGKLDFTVDGENEYYTWRGIEDADWSVSGDVRVENDDEDRFLIYPEGRSFSL